MASGAWSAQNQAGAGSHGNKQGSGNSSTSSEAESTFNYDAMNSDLTTYLLIICASVSVTVVLWKSLEWVDKYTRKIASLGHDRQRYFAIPSPTLSWIKRHLLYAPIFRKRHNREIQLSSAINVGTLPTRFQLAFLFSYFVTNAVFCVIHIPFAGTFTEAAEDLRNRSGMLAVVNMIPLFILAGRNNPLIPLLGISFDTYNLVHRWLGRIVVLEALCHTLAHLAKDGWLEAFPSVFGTTFELWGFIATCAMVAISIQASSPLRHAFYETFKVLHISLAVLSLVALWYHLIPDDFPGGDFLFVVIAAWVLDRTLRALRLWYHNFGLSRTRTVVEAMPGNACRVTIRMARPWASNPGQHAYIYMPGVSLWQSHPFTVAWNDYSTDVNSEKLASSRQDLEAMKTSQVSFVIRARTGFTNSLYKKAVTAPGGKLEVTGWVEGPYGVQHSLDSYGTVVLFAGGVGITHQVPYIKHLVAGFSQATVATRKILLVWTVQSPEHLEWIRPWMTEILGMEKRREVLRIMLFISQPRSTKEIHSPSATVQMFPGRPNIDTLLGMEQDQQIGAMAVTVCGPGALSDEVRRAVRARQSRSQIDFIEEAFSW